MIIVDAHCDTVLRMTELNENLYENKCHVDLKRMHEKGSYLQFFAAFIDQEKYKAYEMKKAVQLIDTLLQQAEIYSDYVYICRNYNDIQQAFMESKTAAVISIEGGEALQGELSALRMFYRLGVRSICLTWNYRNEIADGVGERMSGGGLTQFGREVIGEMNRLGMLVDVSHLSEKGFWDVAGLTKAPIIASHSNAKAICSHRRNLTDEQLIALKTNGGVTGINFCPDFLNSTGVASLDDIIKHIEYIAALTGEEHIGLGADFDGIDNTPEGMRGVEDIHKIFNRLLTLNYSQSFVEKLAGGNFLRVIKEVL